MKRFSTFVCAGLLLAVPALAATTPAATTPAAKAPAAKATAAKAPAAKAAAAKIAPGDLKSGGATWNITAADSLNQALVVDLVAPAPKKPPPGDADALTAVKAYLKAQKTMKGCAASGSPQPVAWSDSSVWVVDVACK